MVEALEGVASAAFVDETAEVIVVVGVALMASVLFNEGIATTTSEGDED